MNDLIRKAIVMKREYDDEIRTLDDITKATATRLNKLRQGIADSAIVLKSQGLAYDAFTDKLAGRRKKPIPYNTVYQWIRRRKAGEL